MHCYPLCETQFNPNEQKPWQHGIFLVYAWHCPPGQAAPRLCCLSPIMTHVEQGGEVQLHLSQKSRGPSLWISNFKLSKNSSPLPVTKHKEGFLEPSFVLYYCPQIRALSRNAHSPRAFMEGQKEPQSSSSWTSSFTRKVLDHYSHNRSKNRKAESSGCFLTFGV